MKKRFVKHICIGDFKEEFYELSIEDCINKYADENDLTIIQFQVCSCTDASVLYEENFERAYKLDFIENMCSNNPKSYRICSQCGMQVADDADRCLNCDAKFTEKPSK